MTRSQAFIQTFANFAHARRDTRAHFEADQDSLRLEMCRGEIAVQEARCLAPKIHAPRAQPGEAGPFVPQAQWPPLQEKYQALGIEIQGAEP
jgi:hypothetical protein